MKILLTLFIIAITGCKQKHDNIVDINYPQNTVQTKAVEVTYKDKIQQVQTGNITPQDLLAFARTLIGTPYKYGSADPAQGFDCSGFITYVFNHFNITVPRSSIGFTNVERQINIEDSKPGDLILFTGTDTTIRDVGHMGIIISKNDNAAEFIHSSSGKANSVTITPLNDYYVTRFVKVIRVFKQNDTN